MLQIKNLSISFANHQVLNNFSLSLKPKKITALVGQSGSGKSVTALAILGLLHKAKVSGEILWTPSCDGVTNENDVLSESNLSPRRVTGSTNLLQLNEKEFCKIRGKEIGFIFQDPNASLNPLHKVGKQIAEAITIHNPKISKKTLQNRVTELLQMVDLESAISRLNDYPHQFSGGQKQRLMIAIAIANNPKILIADEPTTALDVVVQSEILKLLLRLRDELGIAVLLITHNRRVVEKIADEVIDIQKEEFSALWTPQQVRGDSLKKVSANTCHPALVAGSTEQQEILSAKNLSVTYQKNPTLNNINFSLNAGENLGIIGESGSGKSTLALALLNLIPASGEINFFGKKTWKKDRLELRRQVQIIFQDPFSSLDPRMTVAEIIEEGLLIHKIKNSIDDILQKLDLDLNIKARYPHQLSGGQRQRVAIARALILNPKILILDEPTSALDFATQNEILNLLITIQKERQISYILISHDLQVVAQISDKIAVLKDGAILELDEKSKLISNPRHSYTKQLISNL